MCDCGSESETTDQFFLRCLFFAINRQKLLNDLLKIDPSLRNLKDELLLVQLQSLKFQILRLLRARSSLTFRQL